MSNTCIRRMAVGVLVLAAIVAVTVGWSFLLTFVEPLWAQWLGVVAWFLLIAYYTGYGLEALRRRYPPRRIV